jgi:hypothetical protein
VNHVQLQQPPCPPPLIAEPNVPIKPQQLWTQLPTAQQKALVQLLGELLSRSLRPLTTPERTNETH